MINLNTPLKSIKTELATDLYFFIVFIYLFIRIHIKMLKLQTFIIENIIMLMMKT